MNASIPITITIAQRAKLYALGYTEAEVDAMKPSEAHAILNVGNTNGHAPESIADLIAGSIIDPSTIIDVPTAKAIAELLPVMEGYTGLARQAATEALRVLVGFLPEDERKALELPLLEHWYKTKKELDHFFESCSPPPGAPTFKFETLADMFNRPDKQWLIEQVIGLGDIGMIYGPPGCGKTFVVIDLIYSACLNQQWAMRFDVNRPLTVVYAAGEGVSGLKERFRAAAARYNVTDYLPGFSFSSLVPQLYSDGADAMRNFVADWKSRTNAPALDLLIIDTLHSATVGADENSAQDMGQALAAAKVASRELGCAVLLVHHSNKAGTGERGSSAMRGAMDCMIEVAKTSGKFAISCEKLKDGKAWDPQTFGLVAVEDSESVRVWWDPPIDEKAGDKRKSETGREILHLLDSGGGGRALTAKQIGEALGAKPQTVNDVASRLVKDGLAKREMNNRNTWIYGITPEGQTALQEISKAV